MPNQKFTTESENRQDMHKRVSHLRGTFIESMTGIEAFIDEIIAYHFCPENPEKQEELIWAMLASEKITTQNKYNLTSFIFQKHYPSFDTKYNSSPEKKVQEKLAAENKPLLPLSLDTRMGNLFSFRNKLAHRKHLIQEEDLVNYHDKQKAYIRVKVVKNGKLRDDPIEVSDETNAAWAKEVHEVAEIMHELWELVKNANSK